MFGSSHVTAIHSIGAAAAGTQQVDMLMQSLAGTVDPSAWPENASYTSSASISGDHTASMSP
jgi:hypothetical protein